MAPELWDAVRYSVDKTDGYGLYILTGSTIVDNSKINHKGVGRIHRVMMRPMSLYESGDSNGKISLVDLYQGIGRGTTSLVWTVIRELIFAVSFTYLFGIVFGWGLTGIWIGLAVGRGVASFLNFVYAKYTIRMLKSEGVDNDIQKGGYLSVQHLRELIQVLLHQFRHESG